MRVAGLTVADRVRRGLRRSRRRACRQSSCSRLNVTNDGTLGQASPQRRKRLGGRCRCVAADGGPATDSGEIGDRSERASVMPRCPRRHSESGWPVSVSRITTDPFPRIGGIAPWCVVSSGPGRPRGAGTIDRTRTLRSSVCIPVPPCGNPPAQAPGLLVSPCCGNGGRLQRAGTLDRDRLRG